MKNGAPGFGSVFVLVLLMAAGGCSANGTGGAPLDLDEARTVWANSSIDDYSMTIRQTCFCPADLRQPLDVDVVDGQVTHVVGLEQPLEHQELLDTRRLTVEGLFRFIENAKSRDPNRLVVEYNGEYGFPVRIEYDGDAMIADDELQYRITDFRPR